MKRLQSSVLFIALASLLVSVLLGVSLVWAAKGGVPASTAFVSMNGDGTVNYFKDVDTDPSVTGRFEAGAYQVGFTRDVSTCVAVANVHPPTGTVVPAFAMVTRTSSTQVGILIVKHDGTLVDNGFELAVLC